MFMFMFMFSLFETPWTVAHQAPPSMGFSGQEYWSGLPYPPPRDIPDPGIEPAPPAASELQADPLSLSHRGSPLVTLEAKIFRATLEKRVSPHPLPKKRRGGQTKEEKICDKHNQLELKSVSEKETSNVSPFTV